MKTLIILLSLLCVCSDALGCRPIPYVENGVQKEYDSIPDYPSDEFLKKFFKACVAHRRKIWPEWGRSSAAERKRNYTDARLAIDKVVKMCYDDGYSFGSNEYNKERSREIAVADKADTFKYVKRKMYEYTPGDVRDIWENGREFKLLRNTKVKDLKECIDCEYEKYCFRCPGISYLLTGSFTKPYPDACRQARIRKEVYG